MLVASGGLGKEVNSLLRAVSLPGSELVMPVLLSGQMHSRARRRSAAGSCRRGLRLGATGREMWRSYTGLSETGGRMAFIHTVRSVIDPLGQRVSARDRLYLASEVPTLIMWGDRDRIIPVEPRPRRPRAHPGQHPRRAARASATSCPTDAAPDVPRGVRGVRGRHRAGARHRGGVPLAPPRALGAERLSGLGAPRLVSSRPGYSLGRSDHFGPRDFQRRGVNPYSWPSWTCTPTRP